MAWAGVALLVVGQAFLPGMATAAETNAAAEQRLADAVRYLASDELAGRGVGTPGLDQAADYIAAEFSKIGLETSLFDGAPFQRFTVTIETELGPPEENRLKLIGPPGEAGEEPPRIELKLGRDFNTLAVGGTGEVAAPVVFVGYGITAKEHDYDDYAGLDVKGKVVLMLRKEPQQTNPHSAFDGTKSSRHATFMQKIANASEHGAAAVIIVNDRLELQQNRDRAAKQWREATDKLVKAHREFASIQEPTDEQSREHAKEITALAARIAKLGEQIGEEADNDQILAFHEAGNDTTHRNMPVFFCSRAVVEPAIKQALGVDLGELEKQIDKGPTPHSQPRAGWTVDCESSVIARQAEVRNVVAVLEGEGPLADETVVVGAHYDHLGMGGEGSLAPWTKAIHNGADDNASGAAALLEVARQLAARGKPARRIVFIAFTGEERGLLGSAHYIRNPRFSLENTVAMVNIDMVGRLNNDKLIVHGTGTAEQFDGLVDELNKASGFEIAKQPGGFGPSDHSSFYARKIPVLHVFTDTHEDYHRPSDDFEKINVAGMRRVADFVTEFTARVVSAPDRPYYLETKAPQFARGGGNRPFFGSIPSFSQQVEGYALQGVSGGGPAEKAGLKAEDVIVKFGESKITNLEDFDSALRKFKAGDKVKVIALRDGKEMEFTVELDPPR